MNIKNLSYYCEYYSRGFGLYCLNIIMCVLCVCVCVFMCIDGCVMAGLYT